jgi:chromate transport protein ChrA
VEDVSRLIEILLAIALLAIATIVIAPVAATITTPGWIETADFRDWASMTFFLSVAAVFLLVALRLIFSGRQSVRGLLRSRDWWVIAVLALVATICVAIASHWTIALPGLLVIAAAALVARRRARLERLVLVESDPEQSPPRSSFTTRQSSGPRPV